MSRPAAIRPLREARSPENGPSSLRALVAGALAEDLGERGDITSALMLPADLAAQALLVAREPGVLAGREVGEEVLRQSGCAARWAVRDGSALDAGQVLAFVSGPARSLLAAERTLLNLLARLSGIATLTARYVAAAAPAAVLDTRKTTPGLRALEKAAVRAGGGTSHRMGLFDRVLVKDNHLALAGPYADLPAVVARARREWPDVLVEVEADDLDGVEQALLAGADWVLLDNMSPEMMAEAVARAAGRAKLEASGGMTPEGARAAAAAGVDAVSVGALTHSAPALDLALDIEG